MEHLLGLNDEQKRAVLEGDGAALVVAGPGSGKTRTIVHRISHILKMGARPESILLLTFTNKAAQEMKRRSCEASGADAAGVMAGTFHHFANILLRRHAPMAGLKTRFTILDDDDSRTVLLRAARKHYPDAKRALASSIGRAISLSKLRMQPLSDVVMNEPDFYQIARDLPSLEAAAKDYESDKRTTDSLDFDDLLVQAHLLLAQNPDLLSRYRAQYKDILVDEFQDTDRVQAAILNLLYPLGSDKSGRNLMVVGDDSQSIYSFRGADIRNMLEFKDRFNAKVFFLSINYRSKDPIVRLINKCMEGSSARIEKTLLSAGKGGDLPRLFEAANPAEEAFVIARMMEQELLSGNSVGVLFRSVYLASELELELNRRGLKYELRGGLKFAEQAHIKDMLSFLRFYENPKDRTAASRLMMLIPGVGEKKADSLLSGISGWEEAADRLSRSGSARAPQAVEFSKMMRAILSQGGNPASILDGFYSSFYRDYLERSFDDAAERKPDIDSLIGAAAKCLTIGEFLDGFALSPEAPPSLVAMDGKDAPALILSTIHQAKGLEWDVVFLMGLADGSLPHARSSDIEEERRLFYVAASRARSRLVMSYPRASGRFYDVAESRLSRFVMELPGNCYAVEGS